MYFIRTKYNNMANMCAGGEDILRRTVYWLLGIFVVLHGLLGTVSAAVDFKTDLGFGGYVVPGRCTPLRISIDGFKGSARVELEEMDQRRSIRTSCPIVASGERTNLEIPIYARETGSRYRIQLVKDDKVVTSTNVDTSQRIFPGHLILEYGLSPKTRQTLENILSPEEPVLVVGVEAADLPKTVPGYDGVSAVVIRDTGPVLNPSQIQALRVWLSGGGRLVVFAQRPFEDSLLFGLISEPMNPRESIEMGLGRIVALDNPLSSENIEGVQFWSKLLALKPFTESKRLSILSAFQRRKTHLIPHVFSWWIVLFFGAWVSGTILIRRFQQRASLGLLVLFVVMTLISIPLARGLAREWHRGTHIHLRVLALPDGDGLFFEKHIRTRRRGVWRGMMGYRPSPWQTVIAQRYGGGVIGEGRHGHVVWNHRVRAPQQLNLPTEEGLHGVGWMPFSIKGNEEKIQAFLVGSLAAGIWEKGQCQVLQRNEDGSTMWVSSSDLPKMLQEEADWYESLTTFDSERRWVFGYGVIPEFDLSVQRSSATEGFWAIPIDGGEEQ